jgi:hypothetical protein
MRKLIKPLSLRTNKPQHFKPILQTLHTGGSGFGMSYWLKWLDCQEKAFLDEQRSEETSGLPKDEGSQIGILGHSFLELYYKGVDFQTPAVQFVQENKGAIDVDEKCRIEAERVFRAYRARFSATELGQVVGVEKQLEGPKIENAVGISPFTARIDLAVKVNEKVAGEQKKRFGMDLSPGYYLVDHKFLKSQGQNTVDEYLLAHQGTAYQLAWNAEFPKYECKGMIMNLLLKTKACEVVRFLVPPPSRAAIESLKYTLKLAYIYKTEHERTKNTKHCVSWRGVCRYYLTGECKRH